MCKSIVSYNDITNLCYLEESNIAIVVVGAWRLYSRTIHLNRVFYRYLICF